MTSTRPVLAVLFALVVAWWLHLRHFLRLLPERIATHFDGSGVPNGWMSRSTLGTFDFIFLFSLLAVVIGVAFLVRVIPTSLINVPNRDHWFAPERRRESHARMFAHMLWLACLLVAFIIGVNQLTFMANLRHGDAHLPGTGFVILLVAFLAALIAWVVGLYRMFPRPRG
jgi:uncharacterized membrane protein